MKATGEKIVRQLVSEAGLQLLEIHRSGGGHIKARVRSADGREECQVFSSTSSDSRRSRLNKLAGLKRFARGQSTIPERKQS